MSSVNYAKLKTNLSLAMQRLKLLEKKKTELTQKSRKEIANYLQENRVDRAKIRVEHIIREDYMVEAMEIVEMYCDLLLARFGMIQQMKTMDDGLEEAIASLIWVSPRMQADVKELKVIADILAYKYGKPFAMAARENSHKTVSEKLMVKLGVQAPPKILVEKYLIEIAKCLNVDYEPDYDVLREDEMYQKPGNKPGSGGGGLSTFSDGGSEPTPPLLDLSNDFSRMPMPGHGPMVLPPPLPSMPPSMPYPSDSSDLTSNTKLPIGFNLNKEKEGGESGISGTMSVQPSAPGSMSIPPSYNSVMGGVSPPNPNSNNRNNEPGTSSGIPQLPQVPNLPDIPTGDLSDGEGSNNNKNDPNNIDFDDIRRRFDALKKKKF